MSKIKYLITGTIFLCFLIAGIVAVRLNSVKAEETTSTTFPVDEAGITAYVKLDSIDITDLTEAWASYHSRESQDETYVIGTVRVPNEDGVNYPHLYIGLDGWTIAYYKKDQEASRITQWRGYEKGTIKTTTLKDAIDIMCASIGVTYSTAIKYYDFGFPEANKMTLIAETVLAEYYKPGGKNGFSVTVPGLIYEASYTINPRGLDHLSLSIDNTEICRYSSCGNYYGYYPSALFTSNIPHYIELIASSGWAGGMYWGRGATVIIYRN